MVPAPERERATYIIMESKGGERDRERWRSREGKKGKEREREGNSGPGL